MIIGGFLVTAVRMLLDCWLRWRRGKREWQQHVDLSEMQACLLSTEHLARLGRIEKRTLFVKALSKVFRNPYILNQVLEAGERAAHSDGIVLHELGNEDKWHVLNTCTNRLSACFAPYHIFFNEARREDSTYKSAWYCFTLTCAQTAAPGRWAVTPSRPVAPQDDVGVMRIRIVLINEQELRDIASGAIEAPSFGFFNGRHKARWDVCVRFAELFQRQLQRATGSEDLFASWGQNLCGRLHRSVRSSPEFGKSSSPELGAVPQPRVEREARSEDNAMHRMHIPFPTALALGKRDPHRNPEDAVCKDVVLYE